MVKLSSGQDLEYFGSVCMRLKDYDCHLKITVNNIKGSHTFFINQKFVYLNEISKLKYKMGLFNENQLEKELRLKFSYGSWTFPDVKDFVVSEDLTKYLDFCFRAYRRYKDKSLWKYSYLVGIKQKFIDQCKSEKDYAFYHANCFRHPLRVFMDIDAPKIETCYWVDVIDYEQPKPAFILQDSYIIAYLLPKKLVGWYNRKFGQNVRIYKQC